MRVWALKEQKKEGRRGGKTTKADGKTTNYWELNKGRMRVEWGENEGLTTVSDTSLLWLFNVSLGLNIDLFEDPSNQRLMPSTVFQGEDKPGGIRGGD